MGNSVLVALLGSGIFTVLLKVIDVKWFSKKDKEDYGTSIRNELRTDNNQYRKDLEISTIEKSKAFREVDYWKKIYFQLIELLYKSHIDVPDKFLQPYRDDPSTPDLPKKE